MYFYFNYAMHKGLTALQVNVEVPLILQLWSSRSGIRKEIKWYQDFKSSIGTCLPYWSLMFILS